MKFNFKKPSKKGILISSAAALILVIGCGVWYYLGHSSSEPVYVYPFQMVGMTEYWGDSQESYGPVSTDKIQTIFLSDTQTVTEVCVKEGDQVKKGDLLMTFDTTLSDLALERKRLDVEKLKLQMKEAQKQLREINSMEPMEEVEFEPPEAIDPDLGEPLNGTVEISTNKQYDGSTEGKALICWVGNGTPLNQDLFDWILGYAGEYQQANRPEPEPTEPEPPATDPPATDPPATDPPATDPPATDPPATDPPATDPPATDPPATDPPATDPPATDPPATDPPETDPPVTDPPETQNETVTEENIPSNASSASDGNDDSQLVVNDCYVVFKMTAGNMSRGQILAWAGLHIDRDGSFTFFDASGVPDHTLSEPDFGDMIEPPEIDFGSGFTAAQIAQMRSDQQKKIKDLDFQIKMADAEYRIMQTEMSDGNIYSDIDGKVISLLSEEEAKDQSLPVMKVSGGGGFFIDGTVNELDKDALKIGQEVTINDWRGGGTYTGTIQEIGDFPSMDASWNGMGNPNASFYPFRVFVDETADLQADSFVSVMYSAGASENGIYLQNPFLRTEKGRSYVMVQGADGRLEQRFVTVGKALWGSYTEILSGLTAEDKVAFPYGKTVKPGVAALEGDVSDLYG